MSKLLLFDADSIVFTVAWQFRNRKTSNLVKLNTNKFISDVLVNSGADDYIGFYASKEDGDLPNFRYAVDPNYKANRPETPDFVVKWRPTIHGIFKDKWGFMPVDGMEADDAVVITAKKYENDYDEIIIATFDKDLKTIPNITWYNMKDHTMLPISKFDASYNFYKQVLMGDSSDNITGIPGVGKKGAEKLLKDCTSIYGLYRTTVKAYSEFRQKLVEKEQKAVTALIKAEIKDAAEQNGGVAIGEYANLTDARLNRKIRINTKAAVEETVEAIVPGGWKKYYLQQYTLLKMLTEAPDFFTIPDITSSPVKDLIKDGNVSAKPTKVNKVTMDDFLTI